MKTSPLKASLCTAVALLLLAVVSDLIGLSVVWDDIAGRRSPWWPSWWAARPWTPVTDGDGKGSDDSGRSQRAHPSPGGPPGSSP